MARRPAWEAGGLRDLGLSLSLERTFARLAHWAWTSERVRARGPAGWLYRTLRVAWLALAGMLRDQLSLRAAALTYITVLSLGPLLALSFAVAKGLGLYEDLMQKTVRPMLDRTFGSRGPVAGLAGETEHALRTLIEDLFAVIERTDVRALGIVGLLVVLWTGLKLLSATEATFNDIFGAERARSLVRRVTDYLAMVVVPPILIVAATAGLAALRLTSGAEQSEASGLVEFGSRALPFLAAWAVFTFGYAVMPNTRTRFLSALLGGLVAAILWQIAMWLHVRFQVGVAKYDAIYSSFAALPIFLFWVYASWVIVLFGAELCFAHQSEPSYLHSPGEPKDERGVLEVVGLRAAALVAHDFLRGAPPLSGTQLAERLGLPLPTVRAALERLADANLLVAVEGDPGGWVLARDPGTVRVQQVLDALGGGGARARLEHASATDARCEELLAGLDADVAASRHNLSLRELAADALARDADGEAVLQPAARAKAAPRR